MSKENETQPRLNPKKVQVEVGGKRIHHAADGEYAPFENPPKRKPGKTKKDEVRNG